jgi:hypothetical protein
MGAVCRNQRSGQIESKVGDITSFKQLNPTSEFSGSRLIEIRFGASLPRPSMKGLAHPWTRFLLPANPESDDFCI